MGDDATGGAREGPPGAGVSECGGAKCHYMPRVHS
jgi:hypothetical protein